MIDKFYPCASENKKCDSLTYTRFSNMYQYDVSTHLAYGKYYMHMYVVKRLFLFYCSINLNHINENYTFNFNISWKYYFVSLKSLNKTFSFRLL